MYKETFRILSKRLLKHITKEQKKQYLKDISNRLYQTHWWKNSDVIALTIARDIELDTLPIIEEGWKQGKQIVIPKCYPDNHLMNFYLFTNQHELENVYLDLYEPKEDPKKLVQPNQIDLIIVPGLLFDFQGFRIGYGGGYYDRYLANYPHSKISLAMEQQLVKHVPHDQYDLPVDAVISEKNIYQ
ncbi:5-formyltetrahydrofolate cyclo-ligase [Piscibacillus halophilus]|uniref:5-formyltetrahydrofolate cyclo-ligase n=1 Tax=Piscibacillus halophilus TaxID=571933 RepID=A0A1H9MCA7_9BACI|nr:5-formyltetrahydrofolate cyclo-ligase [Piscibacillus halophilus]SER21314.1 5-formyltetrahydrofolate cyclo-ligase [Piscibacillus halophilus]